MRARGNFDYSILTFSRALELVHDAKDKKDYETDILINLGLLYWNIGQTKISLDFFVKAENSSKEQGLVGKNQFCRSVIQLTNLYFKAKDLRDEPAIKDYPESIKTFEQAIDIARKRIAFLNAEDRRWICGLTAAQVWPSLDGTA